MFPPLLDPAHDTLADDICGLSAHIAAAQAELAAKTARFNATMAWAEGGIRSCAEFLSQNAGLDLGTGHDLIGVGDALDRLPLLAEACAAGELSFDKARAVASVATEVDQEMWVELARQCTGSQVVRICRGVRRAMAAAEPEQGRRHQALRGVIQTWRDDGMVRLVALLAPEDGAVVLAQVRRKQEETKSTNWGYEVMSGQIVDLPKAGIIDPVKVVRSAVENGASIAAMILTTEALITDLPEKDKTPSMPGGGGMDY